MERKIEVATFALKDRDCEFAWKTPLHGRVAKVAAPLGGLDLRYWS